MNHWLGLCLAVSVGMAGEYSAADRSFSVQVPAGWHIRQAVIAGQEVHVAEPDAGGPEKVFLGAGFATARNLQELSQQAAGVAAQLVPGLRLASAPQLGQGAGEQRYAGGFALGMPVFGWHGFLLKDQLYFGVLALAPPQKLETVAQAATAMFRSVRLGQIPRNTRLEQAVQGNWVLDDNRSSGLGTSSSVMTMSHWKLTFLPNGRFQSSKEMFTSSSQGDYGGSVGAGSNHTGTYAIYGNTLVADIAGAGRQAFQVWVGGGGLKLNGMLFLRP